MSSTRDGALANITLHPGVIVLGALVLVRVGRGVWPLGPEWGAAAVIRSVGMSVKWAGILTLCVAYGAMALARTTINPRRHTRTVVTTGIYRFTRNPIYLGWFLYLLGGGLEGLSLFRVSIALCAIALLHWAVVLHEEQYLENTFGEDYLQYKRRVRRWL